MAFLSSGKVVALIWMKVLLKLIYVIKVIQHLLFFPDFPATFLIWLTYMLLIFQHTYLPISSHLPLLILHLGNSTAKAYLCNQGGTASLSFQTSLPHFESG